MTREFTFLSTSALIAACAIALTVNLQLHTDITTLLLYVSGSFLFALFAIFSSAASLTQLDPFQNGETAVSVLTVVLVSSFFSTVLPAIIAILISVICTWHIVTKKVLGEGRKDALLIGAMMNLIVPVVLLYLVRTGNSSHEGLIKKTMAGYLHAAAASLPWTIAIAGLLAVLLPLYLILRPEIKFHSLGKKFVEGSGMHSPAGLNLLQLAYGTVASMVFLTLGLLTGCALYMARTRFFSGNTPAGLLILVLYTQILLLLTHFISIYAVVLISVTISYMLSFMISKEKRFQPA